MGEKLGFFAIYQQPADKKKFDKRYQKHLEVVGEQIGDVVESAEVVKVDDSVIYQIATVKFKQGTDADAVFNSAGMKAVADDVDDFVPKGKVKIVPILEKIA